MARDPFDAFVPGANKVVYSTARGPLSGLSFAVKDLIDVADFVTGGGNPQWTAGQQAAAKHAPCVERLLAAGATCLGKTITDELAFSLEGVNAHFGTPRNPLGADLLPGGSSSGSAVAVAAGLVDMALGTDTGGSVRVPAAFCGIGGFRPSHGAIPLDGVLPFAPSLDTVGWFARDGQMLARMGEVLLGSEATQLPQRFVIAEDVFALCEPEARGALLEAAHRFTPRPVALMSDPAPWAAAYRAIQGREIAHTLGPWIKTRRPKFGADIAARFADALTIRDEEVNDALAFRVAQTELIQGLLDDGTALILPTVPGFPLKRDCSGEAIGAFYGISLAINAIAGFSGSPQLTLPITQAGGLPLSLSFVMARGSDTSLLALARNEPHFVIS